MQGWIQATLLVAAGGATGSAARYWLGVGVRSLGWVQTFPLGTFVINVTGSFVLALCAWAFLVRQPPYGQHWWLLLGVGFCGGYTTFSTFEVENYQLVTEGHHALALLNALGSVVAGYLGVVLGTQLGKWLG